MKSGATISLWVVAVLALGLSGLALYKAVYGNKVGYIELATVFNDFEMTKEYKKKLDVVVNARKTITDSLELNLKAQSRALSGGGKVSNAAAEDFQYNREVYIEKAKQYQEDNMALKQQYDTEINKQLNQYIKEYGDKHHYRYIYGAEGSGVLMYAIEGDNISKEVTHYINERYKGGAK